MRKIRFITPERRVAGRDYWLGILNGTLFILADALSDPYLVLNLFIRELGAPLALVGLLPALRKGGFLLPQLVAAGRLQGRHLVLPVYQRAALARFLVWSVLTAIIFFATDLGSSTALWLFLLFYTAYSLASGASGIPFQEVVAKVIPPRRRGSFLGYRYLFGGLLAFFVGGPIVRASLADDASFPSNYGMLAMLALVCIGAGLASFSLVREPRAAQVGERRSTRAMLSYVPQLLRCDPVYRRFISVRLLGRLGTIADPFYVIYAREVFHVPTRMVGIYLAIRMLSAALSNIYWSRVADHQGPQRLTVLTSAVAVLAPLAALLIPLPLHLFGLSGTWAAYSFGLIFLLIGLSMDGLVTAGTTYILELAPPAERASYIGVSNTLLGIATFFPVLGGVLAELIGYSGIFFVALLATISAWIFSRTLPVLKQD